MQNILTKDDIKFLKELAIELKTQDRQYTAKPVFYQIAEQKKIIGIDPDYADNQIVCSYNGDEWEGEFEEVCDRLAEHFELDTSDEDFQFIKEYGTYDELIEYIEKKTGYDQLYTTGYDYYTEYKNAFLTNKACEKHLKENQHHYDKENSYVYGSHAWRNPELERLLEIVEKFADVEVD